MWENKYDEEHTKYAGFNTKYPNDLKWQITFTCLSVKSKPSGFIFRDNVCL